jgi:hypothetical protein
MELTIRRKKLHYKKYVLSYVKYDMAVNSINCVIYLSLNPFGRADEKTRARTP